MAKEKPDLPTIEEAMIFLAEKVDEGVACKPLLDSFVRDYQKPTEAERIRKLVS